MLLLAFVSFALTIGECGCAKITTPLAKEFVPPGMAPWELYAPLGREFDQIPLEESHEHVAELDRQIVFVSGATNADPGRVARLHTERGLWRRAAKDLAGAVKDFTAAIETEPNDWAPRFHRWQAYIKLGEKENAEKDRRIGKQLNRAVFERSYYDRGGLI